MADELGADVLETDALVLAVSDKDEVLDTDATEVKDAVAVKLATDVTETDGLAAFEGEVEIDAPDDKDAVAVKLASEVVEADGVRLSEPELDGEAPLDKDAVAVELATEVIEGVTEWEADEEIEASDVRDAVGDVLTAEVSELEALGTTVSDCDIELVIDTLGTIEAEAEGDGCEDFEAETDGEEENDGKLGSVSASVSKSVSKSVPNVSSVSSKSVLSRSVLSVASSG